MSISDPEAERRAAHKRAARERARHSQEVRLASVVGAHGALFTSLRRGALQAQDRLEEEELIPMFSASRNSVRGALKLLAAEGLVTRAPRRGTQVVARPLDVPLDIGAGWGPGPEPTDDSRRIVVTDQRWVASTPVSRWCLRTDEPQVFQSAVTEIHRGRPVMLYTRFTLTEGADRPLIVGNDDGDFATLFQRTYASPLSRVECWLDAKAADKHAAARLEVPVGTPLIVKSRVLTDAHGRRREYSISHYLAAQVTMSSQALDEMGGREPVTELASDASVVGDPDPLPARDDLLRRSATDLHTELRTAIRTGMLDRGGRLDEERLARAFGASPTTVRAALARLQREGVVARDRDGVVLAAPISSFSLHSGRPYAAADQPHFRSERLTSSLVQVPPFLRGMLESPSGRLHRDEHVSRRDGRPLMIFIRYSDGGMAQPRPLTSEAGEDDFAGLFRAAYGKLPGRIDSWVHAIRADEQIARRLDVAPGTVLLLLERLTHDVDGVARELSHSYILAGVVSLGIRQDVRPEASRR